MRALDAARATMETAGPHQLGLETQLASARAESAKLADETALLVKEATTLPSVREALRSTEEELQAASTRLRQASQLVGEARQMVAWLDSKEQESAELAVQRDALAHDVTAYTQLAEAFGKNGIQEMVVEQALPEIEEIANDLLARLTDGRMRLTLVTQRQGRTVGSINTLEILVRDELGSRPYELFSGGEKFRINFSVRIALSKLLARRANAPLQMLAVDEGFGSQDRDGCDRLIEAIRVVQDDFEKVLVITHLEELKDAFPVRIEVTKGPTGSTFALV
jgi:exonuclease SbcC